MAKKMTIAGVKGTLSASNRKNKKWKFTPDNKKIAPVHAGAKGFTIAASTKRGDAYCARSSGIKSSKKLSPNAVARKMWNCKGKKSKKLNGTKTKQKN